MLNIQKNINDLQNLNWTSAPVCKVLQLIMDLKARQSLCKIIHARLK